MNNVVFVEYQEPWFHPNKSGEVIGNLTITMTIDDAIEVAHSMAEFYGQQRYPDDREALLDFIATHFAALVNVYSERIIGPDIDEILEEL